MLEKKLGLGTVQFGMNYGISNSGGQTSPSEVEKILSLANEKGIDLLDTASAYGNSENVLGSNDLGSFKIVSKFMIEGSRIQIEQQLDNSLNNLCSSAVYGYLAHRPMEVVTNPVLWKNLQELKIIGKVEKIGFSLNEPSELELLLAKGFFPDLVQVPYNYLDRRFEEGLKELQFRGCEIHTRSTFLQGLFFMNIKNLSSHFLKIQPLLQKLQEMKNLAGALLKFVLEKPFIDKVIIGVENAQQLEQNLSAIVRAEVLPEFKEKIPDNIIIPSRWTKN